jgi:hypothetical protein
MNITEKIEKYISEHKIKTIKCIRCGKGSVELTGSTNTCEHCFADYNQAGRWLPNRSQWGEKIS